MSARVVMMTERWAASALDTHVFRKIGCGGRRHSSKNPLMKQEQEENYANHSKRNGETIIQRTAPVGCDAVM